MKIQDKMKISEIVEYWTNKGIRVKKGCNLDDIKELERELDFEFPEDFKEFYLQINGFEDTEMEENMFTIYSLERIIEEYIDEGPLDFIPYSDYLINSHQLGFSMNKLGIYIVSGNGKVYCHNKIAETFIESLVAIINDSEKVY